MRPELKCLSSEALSTAATEEIASVECRFVNYSKINNDYSQPDLHVVKEVITYKDGRVEPNLRFVYDYQFPFWVTRKGFRNHQQPKEWEEIKKLQVYHTTQRQKINKIATAIGQPYFRGNERKLFECPYIYGADISSRAQIKKEYLKLQPEENQSFFTLAEFDIETDLQSDREEATMGSLFMPDYTGKGPSKLFTVVCRSFLGGISDDVALAQIEKVTKEQLGTARARLKENGTPELEEDGTPKMDPSDFEVFNIIDETIIVENDLQMWQQILAKCHEWQPDLLSIWNMEFEMDKFMAMCEFYNVDAADLFCDPRVPREYRTFSYEKGKSQKETASGKVMPIPPHARWHTVTSLASFYVIDQMGAYRQTRTGEQEEPSYSLNAIQQKVIKRSKLHGEAGGHLQSGSYDWHQFMQVHEKIFYIVYNKFDTVGPALIEKELLDLQMTLPMMSMCSDFANFPSQPKRCVDDLHWYVQEDHAHVIGVTSSALVDEYADEVLDLKDWIITLPAPLIKEKESGELIFESKNIMVRVYTHVGD